MKTLKKRINLYTADLLPPQLRLSFQRLVKGSVAFIVLCSLIALLAIFDNQSLKTELAQLATKKNELDQQKSNLEQKLASRQPNPNLVTSLGLISKRLQIKQLLQTELNRRTTVNSMGFSPLLKDLASVSMSELWLTQISVQHEQIMFKGYSINADMVPVWVNRLKTTNTLNGHSFASMTMNRNDNEPIAFNLSSQDSNSMPENVQ